MEKIWSSCVYYYGLSKKLQNTFRIAVQFSSAIDEDLMRASLDMTQKRYPYFSIRRVKTFREIFLEDNELSWVLKEGGKPIALGGKESNFHMLAFSYEKDWLYVDGFHGMTDGNGIMNLLRTLIYYYCREAYDENIKPGDIRLAGEPVSREEIEDPYQKLRLQAKDDEKKSAAKKQAKYMNLAEENNCTITKPYVFRLQIPQQELMKYCGQNDGSPATAIALFMARAVKKLHKDSKHLIGCGVAADLRTALGTKQSHQSTVAMPVLEFTNRIAEREFEVQGTAFRGQVLLKCDADTLAEELYASNKFYAFINGLPLRKLKELIMRAVVKMALRGPTVSVSYVGKCNFGECEKYVKQIFSEPDAPGTGILIEINALNDIFCVAFIQEWQERTYFEAFCKELEECGITCTRKSEGQVLIPKMERIVNGIDRKRGI